VRTAGAKTQVVGENGTTPLHCLGSTGYVEIVKYFVEMCGENIYAVNSDGDTPLHISAGSWCDQWKVLKCFVEKCSANVIIL
jgi:ankyrin repeat protein